MGKVKIEYEELSTLREKLQYQDRKIQQLSARNERLEKALTFAEELIPKEKLPVGVGSNVIGWLINQGQHRTWRIDDEAEAAKARALDYAKRHNCRVYNYLNGSNKWYTEDGKEISDGHKNED